VGIEDSDGERKMFKSGREGDSFVGERKVQQRGKLGFLYCEKLNGPMNGIHRSKLDDKI
jgi:hypothetical protein